MPLIYRVMKVENGRPKVGTSGSCLGARVGPLPPPQVPDITPDQYDNVHRGTGGMSVAPTLLDLPPMIVPETYLRMQPKAMSRDKKARIWKMGAGPFVAGPIAEALELRVDAKDNTHGFVEPDKVMPVSRYQEALAATKDKWDEVKI